MSTFGTDYLGKGEELFPTALFISSHHARNQIFFGPGDILLSTSVQRKFQKPSIAILNGCGTGGVGADDFVRELNKRGVAAVIATSAEIRTTIATDFLNAFLEVTEKNKNKTDFTLSQAYFQTLQMLRGKEQDGVTCGPFALTYALMGNGNLRLCQPVRRVP